MLEEGEGERRERGREGERERRRREGGRERRVRVREGGERETEREGGERETEWRESREGKTRVKDIIITDTQACYIASTRTEYTRVCTCTYSNMAT